MTEEATDIIRKLAELHAAHLALPVPPKWKKRDLRSWELDRDYGPLWQPSSWFVRRNRVLTAKWSKRYQRAARGLIADGLAEDVTDCERLTRLKLTTAGHAAAADLKATTEGAR